MVRIRIVFSIVLFTVMLLVTMFSAMAQSDDVLNEILIEKITLEESVLSVEYLPKSGSEDLLVCVINLDNETRVPNIISTPNKLNRVVEELDLVAEEYYLEIGCMQKGIEVKSKKYLLKLSGEELIEENSTDAGWLTNSKEVFFTVVVLIAAIIIIKSLIPGVNKKKNKRLKRFS